MRYDKQTQKLFTKLDFLAEYFEIDIFADSDGVRVWSKSKRKTAESFDLDFVGPVTDSVLARLESVLDECIERDR